jgi:hypothetical protein
MVARGISRKDGRVSTEFPPVGVCTKCGDITYDLSRLNGSCGRFRCKGIYGSALNNNDWATCDACNGTCVTDIENSCPRCQRTGWILSAIVRDDKFKLGHYRRARLPVMCIGPWLKRPGDGADRVAAARCLLTVGPAEYHAE